MRIKNYKIKEMKSKCFFGLGSGIFFSVIISLIIGAGIMPGIFGGLFGGTIAILIVESMEASEKKRS